jgi:hypothetical protein
VALTLTDAASVTASTTYATTINYTGGLGVTITGPTYLYKATGCKAGSWAATITGATAPFCYAWTLDGAAAGTGSTLTESFCPYDVETVIVGLTVTDCASRSGSATLPVSVDVEGGDPCPLCSQTGPTH